ncbi:DEAD/DEAH box helicase [Pseudomonas citronellolis]|uniref:DEAD/DEAH box helicase n=1 Tax=Pseudomonas citronellolis TaxID=53408 RepID=UPI0023E413E7|nr:DEAD/DEAH box helicase [Pseudomonas citronellolis]MDF3931005.1 DEAD/DEAH box helicase [Pseudomonas citronellolis]
MSSFADHLQRIPWRRLFPAVTLVRGEAYAREGRVQITRLTERGLDSLCQGSNRNRYRQSIKLSRSGDTLDCSCDCPVGFDCKHCAAALLHLLETQTTSSTTPTPPPEPSKPRPQAPASSLSPLLQTWLKKLPATLKAQAPAREPYSQPLNYRLTKSGRVFIHTTVHDDKGHILGYPRIQSIALTLGRGVSEQDQPILMRALGVTGVQPHDNEVLLQGSAGAELLALLLDSGQLFLELEDISSRLQPGAELPARLAWHRREDGCHVIAWETDAEPRPQLLTQLSPPWYIDRQGRRAGPLRHDLPDALAGYLLSAPPVPAEQATLFGLQLKELAPTAPLPVATGERRLNDVQPVPHLRLNTLPAGIYDDRDEHQACLEFAYGKERVQGPARSGQPIRYLENGNFVVIERQPKTEQALRKILQHLGLKKLDRQSTPYELEYHYDLYRPALNKQWAQIVRRLPELREQGWVIEIDDDFPFDFSEVEEWYARIDETPGQAWFDLELGIVVDGQHVSLLQPLLELIRQRPSTLRSNSPDRELPIRLDARRQADGKPLTVSLSVARVQSMLRLLEELLLVSPQRNGTRVRVANADVGLLAPLDVYPLNWQGGERLRSFARRLRDYQQRPCPPPSGLLAELRPYQAQGLSWMQSLRELDVGGILGDDMGLGKTLQVLAHILTEKRAGRLDRPALVLMPTSLVANWQDEAQRFAPDLRVLTLHGAARHKDFSDLRHYDLLLSTYALLPRDIEALSQQPLHLAVFDEAQYLKNASSKSAQAAARLDARQRLCLTGTPVENHLGELWALFDLVMPGWLGDVRSFARLYRNPIEKAGDGQRLAHLNARIKPFLLRRKKEQVASELPPKSEITHWVELSDVQRDLYETVRLAMDGKVRAEIQRKGLARSHIVVLEALLKLRQVCCDPRLLDQTLPAAGSGKLTGLLEMLDELLEEGRRVLLFSQFTSMLDLIQAELQGRGIRYALLTGDTRDRRQPVEDFQQGRVPLFLISLKAGGTGLNLTAADTVIHYDPWWNPAAEQQATDRAYRIGQDKPVFVYKLIARGTLEEKIQQLQARKAALAAGVLEDGKDSGLQLQDSDIDALFAPLPKA